MSAPGIQLSSQPYLTYFQPTIRQYLQSIKDAVVSNNLPAARQAFTQLSKAIPSPAQGNSGETHEFAVRISQGVQDLGQALEAGDLGAAQHAVGGLRTEIQSISDAQSRKQESVAEETASSTGPAEDGSIAGGGTNLNVRA